MSLNLVDKDWDIINQDLTDVFAEVTYVRPIKDFFFKARNGSTILHKRRMADTKYMTLDPGVMPDKKVLLSDANAAGASLGFFATATGTETLEVYVVF